MDFEGYPAVREMGYAHLLNRGPRPHIAKPDPGSWVFLAGVNILKIWLLLKRGTIVDLAQRDEAQVGCGGAQLPDNLSPSTIFILKCSSPTIYPYLFLSLHQTISFHFLYPFMDFKRYPAVREMGTPISSTAVRGLISQSQIQDRESF